MDLIGSLDHKKRYRAVRKRTRALPANYREAVDSIQRYLSFFGPDDAENSLEIMENLIAVFETAAATSRSIREIVGDDPVAYADSILVSYPQSSWIHKEKQRLVNAIDEACGDDEDEPEAD